MSGADDLPGASTGLRVLLLDADDCLFPSEVPAFEASTGIVNRLLADIGDARRFLPDELRAVAVGRNFRTTATMLAAEAGVTLDPEDLERRVEDERRAVIAHLRRRLVPDPGVTGPLTALAGHVRLAVVSSSALARLDVCFRATGLADLLPATARFSAEDSLPVPTSKPDPAVYRHALRSLGVPPDAALAVEDSPSGVRSAVGAGIPVVGNLHFVAATERDERARVLREAGAARVVATWAELADLLLPVLDRGGVAAAGGV